MHIVKYNPAILCKMFLPTLQTPKSFTESVFSKCTHRKSVLFPQVHCQCSFFKCTERKGVDGRPLCSAIKPTGSWAAFVKHAQEQMSWVTQNRTGKSTTRNFIASFRLKQI